MPKQTRKVSIARTPFTLKLNEQERGWLTVLAKSMGVSNSDAARMLLHREAEARGWKERAAA